MQTMGRYQKKKLLKSCEILNKIVFYKKMWENFKEIRIFLGSVEKLDWRIFRKILMKFFAHSEEQENSKNEI